MTRDPIERLRAADPLSGELPAALAGRPRVAPVPRRRAAPLVAANVALLVTVLLHGLDHTLQERGITGVSFEVTLGGAAILAASLLSLRAALRAEPRAPLYALVAGPWIAFVIVVGHFVPDWGEFSDSYADAGVGLVSYLAAGAVAVAGLAVAAAALRTYRFQPK